MKIEREALRLYAVTDRSWLRQGESLASVVEELLKAGVTCVQLREKQADDTEFLREAYALKDVCSRYHVPLIINDRPDIARKVEADGVHVGLSDMAIEQAREFLGGDYIIGSSAHNVEEALAAQRAGADYLGCGAVFGSTTKKDMTGLSLTELERICRSVSLPAVAIGGVSRENIGLLKATGVCGAAVVSALFAAPDKGAAARELLKLWDSGK